MSALLQVHLHSQLNTWFQWIGQRPLQVKMRNISALGFVVTYIRDLNVVNAMATDAMTMPVIRASVVCCIDKVLQEYSRFSTSWVNSSPPGQNGHHFADDIFKCIFINEMFCILNQLSLKFIPRGLINNIPALVQIVPSHYLQQSWLICWHIYACHSALVS